MKSCSTTHNKHRGSRSYLCSVSTTNYVRAAPPISTNESDLMVLFLRIWVLCMGVAIVTWKLTEHYEILHLNVFYNLSVHFMKNSQYTTCWGRFMLSSVTKFSSSMPTVFKWYEGKLGQFNTIWIGQALSLIPISWKSLHLLGTFLIWKQLAAVKWNIHGR